MTTEDPAILADGLHKITASPSVAQPWETYTDDVDGEVSVIAQDGDFMVLKYDGYHHGAGPKKSYVPVTYRLVEIERKKKSTLKKVNQSNKSTYSVPAEDFWIREILSCAPGKSWRQQVDLMVQSMGEMAGKRARPYPEHVWPKQNR